MDARLAEKPLDTLVGTTRASQANETFDLLDVSVEDLLLRLESDKSDWMQ